MKALPEVPGFDASAVADIGDTDDLGDLADHELAEAYVTSLEPQVRSAGGRHYTPDALADQMWRQAIEVNGHAPPLPVCDPACGTGALLAPVLREWLAGQSEAAPEAVLARVAGVVTGFDVDPVAVWLGNVLLNAQLLPWWARVPMTQRRRLPDLLSVGDGLTAVERGSSRAVVMNPPYGRVRLSEADRERWGHVLFGHANRYGLFLAAAMEQVVEDGGVLAALVPAGWLGGSYFQRLRGHLAKIGALERLTYVPHRSGVFVTGVLQETVIATFRRGATQAGVLCQRLAEGHRRYQTVEVGWGQLPVDASQPWLLPRSASDVAIVAAGASMTARLGSYGWRAKTGPLVWNRYKNDISADRYPDSVPIVWAADLARGTVSPDPKRDPQRYFRIPADRRAGFLVLDQPALLVQRTTAPEQAQRLVVAGLDRATLSAWGGRVVVENHVNVLTCDDPRSPLTPQLLRALLQSPVVDRLYRCLTGSVAVSAYELAALPLPSRDTLLAWADLDDAAIAGALIGTYGAPC